jgi:hypothetical protein
MVREGTRVKSLVLLSIVLTGMVATLNGQTLTSVKYPGADQTYVMAMNNFGHLVGQAYFNSRQTPISFLYANGKYTVITVANSSGTYVNDIAPDNDNVVGMYVTATGKSRGFTRNGTTHVYKLYNFGPGLSTSLNSLNDPGVACGSYMSDLGSPVAFCFKPVI